MPTPLLVATAGSADANSYVTVEEAWAYIDTLPHTGSWPSRTPATVTVGAGLNGVVTVTVPNDVAPGAAGNAYTVQVVAGVGPGVALSAVVQGVDNDELLVTLGTDGAGAPDATKNTAALVAAAVNALDEFSATASGTGATVVPVTAAKSFSGGDDREDVLIPALIQGTRLLDAIRLSDTLYAWTGAAATAAQALGWPRVGMADRNGFAIGEGLIPRDLKYANVEYARQGLAADLTANSETEGISEVKAGPVAVKFKGDATVTGFKPVPEAVLLLIPRSWLEHESEMPPLFEMLI